MTHVAGTVLKRLVKLPRSPEGCWEWQGRTNNKGVPYKTFNGVPIAARRWLWEQLFGMVPPGLIVYGICGNLNCVNPHHMKCGFDADKTRDATGLFTITDVEEIKRAKHWNRFAQDALAHRLGVKIDRLRDVWRGDRYGRKKGRKSCTGSLSSPACSSTAA